jgi:hypothetical protein
MAPYYTGPPMDLQNGVVCVDAYCACGWQASVNVSPLPDELAVPDVRLRLKYSKWQPADGDAPRLVTIQTPATILRWLNNYRPAFV